MPATDLAHPELNRPLSIQEYKRIQEFPDDWKLSGSLRNQYKQIGNAVPVNLAYAVGRSLVNLLNQIENHEIKPGDIIMLASVGAGMNINAIVYKQ